MSGNFTQSIAQSSSLRQVGTSPAAMAQAADPRQPATAMYEELEGGQEILPSVVILTALPEEFLAVENHLVDRYEVQHLDGTVYECGRFKSDGSVWTVAIVETGQGNVNAADETQRAIAYFNPDLVLFVGVAGGRKDVVIGDVVAAEKVYNYESGQDEDIFQPRPEAGRSSYPLEQRARAVARDWLRRKREPGNESLPRAFVGAIAAGESVVASTNSGTAKLLERNYGDALAVEKEGYGFLAAARRSRGVSAIVIRGISDLLDNKEQADKSGSQELAARHACEFAFELLAKLHGSGSSLAEAATQKEAIGQYQGGKLNLDLNWKPPTSMAILRLEQHSAGYSLRAHHSQLSTLEEAADCLILPIGLGQFGQFQPWTIDTVGKLEGYQPRDCLIGKAIQWLRYLHRTEPAFTCLVIAEPPTSTIPWELLNLGDQALGVALQTVRVSAIVNDEDSVGSKTLDEVGYCCQGSAMVYTCDGELDEGTTNYAVEFQAYCYEAVSYPEPEQILRHLQQVELKIGLIMMADASLQQVAVDRRRFWLKRTRIFKRSPSLIMLQPLLDDNSHRVLATELLEHGAEGVLGMLEAVDRTIAQQVIRLFFQEYRREASVPIPELLRRARQAIAQRLDNELTDEMAQLYLATFLYAYYGHPMTVLQLTLATPQP